MPSTQNAVNNHEYRSVPITALAESATNPRKRFDTKSLEELAAYVPRHISGLLCRSSFCGRGRQTAHQSGRSAIRRTHNDHSEFSHFSSSSSLRQPSLRRDGIEVATGGRQAATAAIFPLRVISA
jgi:hypothetical protein